MGVLRLRWIASLERHRRRKGRRKLAQQDKPNATQHASSGPDSRRIQTVSLEGDSTGFLTDETKSGHRSLKDVGIPADTLFGRGTETPGYEDGFYISGENDAETPEG